MKPRTPLDIPKTVEVVGDVTIERLHPGRLVFCDDCGKDFTDVGEPGGLLYGSKAIGPCCSAKWVAAAKKFDEEHFIRGRCPAGKSFADWVREDLRKT